MINFFRKCSGIIGIFILLMLTLSLTGCGAGRTMVLAPLKRRLSLPRRNFMRIKRQ